MFLGIAFRVCYVYLGFGCIRLSIWRETLPGIHIGSNQPFDSALRFFKKQVEKAGIISELKKRRHYEKPSIRLKKKSIAARKRALKNMRRFGHMG